MNEDDNDELKRELKDKSRVLNSLKKRLRDFKRRNRQLITEIERLECEGTLRDIIVPRMSTSNAGDPVISSGRSSIKRKRDRVSDSTTNTTSKKRKMNAVQIRKVISGIKTIEDIIALESIKFEITHCDRLMQLCATIEPLKRLDAMVGMKEVKRDVFDHILYHMTKDAHSQIPHIVISGPPGCGKTELGRCLGEIYMKMGILKNGKFIIAKRSDLVAEYLGQTAVKTQSKIDEAEGGVLFIDEAYSLGNSTNSNTDSYSNEAINCLNQNLTEKRGSFLCILAGYQKEMRKCLFSKNPGLERRFPIRYTISSYNETEMADIMLGKLKTEAIAHDISRKALEQFFKQNKSGFAHYGGDIENVMFYLKLERSRKGFYSSPVLENHTSTIGEKQWGKALTEVSSNDSEKCVTVNVGDLNRAFGVFEKRSSWKQTGDDSGDDCTSRLMMYV